MLVCSQALTSPLLALHRGTLDRVTQDGNTALHYGALYNQPNCLKLLLKGKATFTTGMKLGWGFWGSLEGVVRLQLGFCPLGSECGGRDGSGCGEEAEIRRV